jgi:hypothetical protein
MIASVALAFLAASSAPAADSAAPAAASVKEKKICRKEEAMTGSITAKRVCKTKAEWEGQVVVRGQTPADLQRSVPTTPIPKN